MFKSTSHLTLICAHALKLKARLGISTLGKHCSKASSRYLETIQVSASLWQAQTHAKLSTISEKGGVPYKPSSTRASNADQQRDSTLGKEAAADLTNVNTKTDTTNVANDTNTHINIPGLKAEAGRMVYRAFKKVDKLTARLLNAQNELELLERDMNAIPGYDCSVEPKPNTTDTSYRSEASSRNAHKDANAATQYQQQQQLYDAVVQAQNSVEAHRLDLDNQRAYLAKLQSFEEDLRGIKNNAKSHSKWQELQALAEELGVADHSPPRQEKVEKVAKIKPTAASAGGSSDPRLPYKSFTSIDGLEIRVGRGAEDNDTLSCDKRYRDSQDWWLHAHGCPGSHVIIRYQKDDLLQLFPETVKDAAILAGVNSKAKNAGQVQVTITRARCISKPKNSPAGMVQLNGTGADLLSFQINLKAEQNRLSRLIDAK